MKTCLHASLVAGISVLLLSGCINVGSAPIHSTPPKAAPNGHGGHEEEPVKIDRYVVTGSNIPRTLPAALLWDTSEKVDEGFGQYTYLLLVDEKTLPANQREQTRRRNLELLSMAIGHTTVEEFHRTGVTYEEINALVLPLHLAEARAELDRMEEENDFPGETSAFVAKVEAYYRNYDFAMAARLIQHLKTAMPSETLAGFGQGPVLFSSREPLQPGEQVKLVNPVVQDLSRCPDAVIGLWCAKFIRDTSQKGYWTTGSAEEVALKIRTLFESLAPDFGHSVEAFKQFATIFGFKVGVDD